MKKFIMGIVVSLAFSGAAMAQGNFYGGVEAGSASVADQTGAIASELVYYLGGYVTVTQSTNVGVFRAFVGYKANPMVALELGYLQSGDANISFAGVTAGNVGYSGTGTDSVSGVDLSAILHPIPAGPWRGLFVRGGLSNYTDTADLTITTGLGINSSSASQSGTGENIGVGYDFKLGTGVLRTELMFAQNIANESSNKSTALQVGYYW